MAIYENIICCWGQTCDVTVIIFLATQLSCCPIWRDLYAELTDLICSSWCSNVFWNVHVTQTTQLQCAGYASLPHLISHPNQPLHCFFFSLLVFSLHSWHSQGNNTELFYWSQWKNVFPFISPYVFMQNPHTVSVLSKCACSPPVQFFRLFK